jgi:pyruvate,water dikinase
MTTGMPSAPRYTPDALPAGFWFWDEHFPLPFTPLYGDFFIGKHFADGFRAAAQEFSGPDPSPVPVSVNGYCYIGFPADHSMPTPELLAAFEQKVRDRHEQVVLQRYHNDIRPAAVREMRRLNDLNLHALTDAELLAHIRQHSDQLSAWWATHFANARAAALVIAQTEEFLHTRLGVGGEEIFQLLAGSSTSSSAPTRRLDELAIAVKQAPELCTALESADPWAVAALREFLRDYIETYGHRPLEFDFAMPTLAEQPEQAVGLLREAMARQGMSETARSQSDAATRVSALRAQLPDEAVRLDFDRTMTEARAAYQVREDDISIVQTGEGFMRYALLEAGRRFAARGILTSEEQVWYLRWPEVEAALAGETTASLEASATARRTERQQQTATPPIPVFGQPGEPGMPPLSEPALKALGAWMKFIERLFPPHEAPTAQVDTTTRALRGVAASRGHYRGPARIIHGPHEFHKVQVGDVVVCPLTNPAWNVLFPRIGALVTDGGGILSHPAILAREFSIPAVVATRTATQDLHDGQIVEVDGTAGAVGY